MPENDGSGGRMTEWRPRCVCRRCLPTHLRLRAPTRFPAEEQAGCRPAGAALGAPNYSCGHPWTGARAFRLVCPFSIERIHSRAHHIGHYHGAEPTSQTLNLLQDGEPCSRVDHPALSQVLRQLARFHRPKLRHHRSELLK